MYFPDIILVDTGHAPGTLAAVLSTIARDGISVDDVRAIQRDHRHTRWEITIAGVEPERLERVLALIDQLPTTKVAGRSDRVFNRHRGGKIRMMSRTAITSLEVLRDVYTPGVARVCLAIQEDATRASEFTSIQHTVAIITNGTAVLGLGDIGPVAGMPVMEGKAALFEQLVDLSGVPILLDSKDPQAFIETVVAIAPSFGAIQLEDVGAPACFDIEQALVQRLRKPVMHDDQHGTAVVVLAALLSATRRFNINLKDCVIGQIGLGAAGLGICSLLLWHGARNVLGADLDANALARLESLGGKRSTLQGVMQQADIVIATTGVPGLIKPEMVRPGQIILALSNPDAEIEPDVALAHGAKYAVDGKVVNNVLGFPGIFKGALEAGAQRITKEMLVAAAEVLSELGGTSGLVPDPLDREVHARVAAAVRAHVLVSDA